MSDPKIEELHRAYCHATGFDLALRMGRDRTWFDFEKAGFTKEDLLLVIKWIRREIPRGTGFTLNSLRFSTLLQLDYFEEKLMLARQAFNGRKPKPPQIVARRDGDISHLVEVAAPDQFTRVGEAGREMLRDLKRKLSGKSGG